MSVVNGQPCPRWVKFSIFIKQSSSFDKNQGIKKAGTGVPNFQRGWKTFVVGPPGLSVKVCLHPWLAAFAYPMNDVVQTSHADIKVKAFQKFLLKFSCFAQVGPQGALQTGRKPNVS